MTLRIALVQFNASVGDIRGNRDAILSHYEQAARKGADVVVFPEMCLCGYPPEDLLLKRHFLLDSEEALEDLAEQCTGPAAVVGYAQPEDAGSHNSLAVIQNGEITHRYSKINLPNYGVFDERRYFQPGLEPLHMQFGDIGVVFTICEDIWQLEWLDTFLKETPPRQLILNISASPFHYGKIHRRQNILAQCARHFDSAVAYCNLIGGQDELVFDGRSMVLDSAGNVICRAKAFEEDMLITDISVEPGSRIQINCIESDETFCADISDDPVTEVYHALVLGTRDYVRKNGFEKVLIGVSGGVDSSLTAAVAVDALGKENVIGISMPSKFNSPETISDAEGLARNLEIEFHEIPIADVLESFDKTLSQMNGWDDKGIAFENLQARIRGTILMSLSNQYGYMVITTGNKSEVAVGYSTLYGDTAGGFAIIKDVPKTMVYELCRYVNETRGREIIPESVITRAPSAELRPDQKDSDSLPDYDMLDGVLKRYVEQDQSRQQIIAQKMPEDLVKRVIRMVDRNEYKRRQNPPGVKITPKAFGRDRRMPITNRYQG